MSAFRKELLRTITRAPGRFLALLAIVALGAGFYAGLRMCAPDMDRALDRYFDETNLYDLRVVCTLGLTDDDLDALRAVDGVKAAEPAFECDVEAAMNGSDYTMRFHSLPRDQNRVQLVEGSWPQTDDECVICADRIMDAPFGVGDAITLTDRTRGNGAALREQSFTVTGLVRTPYYVSQVSLGTSSVGSGIVQQYAFVCEDAFARTVPYAEAFLTVEGASEQFMGSPAYWQAVDRAREGVRAIAPERERHRLETIDDVSGLRIADELPSYAGLLELLEFRLENPRSQTGDAASCEWLVLDRDKNAGAVGFSSDAERVDHIASVFPFVFFLVAALVALTTMTRMVDEERLLIGTYKALGYSRARITGKYLAYALLASGAGSVIGIAVLGRLLPAVIMNAYAIMYRVPNDTYPLDPALSLLSAGLSVGICLGATWFAVARTLRERPAALLLPPAPRTGKRILLERAAPLWRHLSFSWKVTCRNLFRYKKRLVMTLIGIAGCTALLLTGLGLHDAVNDIIDVQYTDIVHYNATVTVTDRVAEADGRTDERRALDQVMTDSDLVHTATPALVQTMLASGPRAADKRFDLVVPADENAFAAMMTLRSRTTRQPLALTDGQAVINEKLAQDLGVSVGDTITVAEQDALGNATSNTRTLTVGALTEVYIYNFAFVNRATYEDVWGYAPVFQTYFADATSDPAAREQLDRLLAQTGAVKTLSFNDETIGTYRTMLRSVDLIVVVLVLSAAALAFIVLYNLTNINIAERVREIATLKVLGFTRAETRAYIFREVALLSVLGCLIGLLLGVPLERFVVTTAEVDQVMFGRAVHAASFVIAFALTLAFSAASMLLMVPKLARIDMVESLKSNE